MIGIDEAVQRAIDCKSQIYNLKQSCPDDQRDAELRNLYHLADIAPNGASAEIGVRTGGSLLCWSCAREGRGQIYAIDDWSSMNVEQIFLDNVKRYGADVRLVIEKSWEAAALIDESFAFVFIDGNHSVGIWRDIPAWTPKIIPGGIIAFHDYDVWKPTVSVKAAVDQWHKQTHWAEIGKVGSTLAFRRPNNGH
jgi:predicted O-methyltransferase YrrM